MNRKLFFWSIVVALGGFLFGVDVAVISGAEQAIKQEWHLSDVMHGLAIGMALYGTVVGALAGGLPASRFGRKKTLMGIGLLYLLSSLGSAWAPDVHIFMLFRFLGGLAIGASSVVAPMYISEIAPAKNRGRLVAIFQFNIVFGILMAYLSNYWLQHLGENSWRWMLGVVALPSFVYCLLLLWVPESPRWLMVHRSDYQRARAILQVSDPSGVEAALAALQQSIDEEKQKESLASFFSGRYTKAMMLAFLIAAFNQLSGINAVIYYAPRVFELAGLGRDAAFLQSAGIGLVNLIFTLLGMYLIDRIGRRKLMLIGSVGYILSLSAVAAAFHWGWLGGLLVPVLLFAFIAAHALGQGAVIWVFISEVFPNSVRAYGQSLGSATHWIFAALAASTFPALAQRFGPAPLFGFFAVMMVLQLLWVLWRMPETKGVPLEQLETQLQKPQHPQKWKEKTTTA